MKKITLILSILLSIWSNDIFSQTQIAVDERFELTSIAFRLTGREIYAQTRPAEYVKDIESYFSKYKEHELVRFLKEVTYSKPVFDISITADLSVDIEITPKGIVYTEKWDRADIGWSEAEQVEYLRLLNKFYKETKFHKFYKAHSDFYAAAEKSLHELVNQIDTAWFCDFFGAPWENVNIFLVPANGRNNFAASRTDHSGKRHCNSLIGCSFTDKNGVPEFDYSTYWVLIHEICHNFCNPVCEKYEAEFMPICDTLFQHVGERLTRNYYGSSGNILYEGLNRVCEFLYLQTHEAPDAPYPLYYRVKKEESIGFVWLGEMLRYMDVFKNNRSHYPTFESFMPQLKHFLQRTADNMEGYYAKKMALTTEKPRVIATFPGNGSVVDTNITEVVIYFSLPMYQNAIWVDYPRDVDESILILPTGDSDDFAYWRDEYTYVVRLSEPLKPRSKYGFRVRDRFPRSNDYSVFAELYDLIFYTK